MWGFSVLKAVLARGLFAVHAFIAIWRVVTIKNGDSSYWLLTTSIGLLICEGMLSICKRRGREMKWFCPSVFLYLCCIIPPTWMMELDLADVRKELRRGSISNNNTSNTTSANQQEKLAAIPGLQIEFNLELSAELWTKVLEQFLLVNLILGRWLLPKGDLTRGQLSQLLLVYIGMAADIVELFEAFKEDAVIDNSELTYTVLALWSWSLMQFTLVLTATKARKPRLGMDSIPKSCDDGSVENQCCCSLQALCIMDTWAIITTIIFQDGPFLCLRLLLIVKYNVVSYLNIFFTCKNSLVLLLQLYRMTVLNCETRKATPKDQCVIESAHLKTAETNYYKSDEPRPKSKYENEFGYFGKYDSKIPTAEYSSSDMEAKPRFDTEFYDYLKSAKMPHRAPKRCRERKLLQNTDLFMDESRDSVVVAFSQNKGAPWTDICLNLRSSKVGIVQQPQQLQTPDVVKLRKCARGEMAKMNDATVQPSTLRDHQSCFPRNGPELRCNRFRQTKTKTSKGKRSPNVTSSNVHPRNYHNLKSPLHNKLETDLRPPQSYYMSTRF